MDKARIIKILTEALGGENAQITIQHTENDGPATTTGTGKEIAENLALWLARESKPARLFVTIHSCEKLSATDLAGCTNCDFEITGTVYREHPTAHGLMQPYQSFAVTVSPWCGEYDYHHARLDITEDEEEEIQVAIGQYFQDNNIDIGTVAR